MNYLVCIHGWNEDSSVFSSFINSLSYQYAHTHVMGMADFMSLDDDVTFDDLVTAMEHAWHTYGLPIAGKKVDVITHSTGALIFRAWLNRYYKGKVSPINHLLMLAPPNFGSHLAHRGRAFIGRVLKGFGHHRPFEVGANLLKGLELASSFTWELAMDDCFSSSAPFNSEDILTTILIGATGYEGIAAAANEPGSDGTVPIACANLNPCMLAIKQGVSGSLEYEVKKSHNEIAFGVIPNVNHRTILGEDDAFTYDVKLCGKALSIKRQQFHAWQRHLAQITLQHSNSYQNILTKVYDQFNNLADDYHLDFECDDDCNPSSYFHDDFVRSVHAFQEDNNYRSFKVDVSHLSSCNFSEINISMTAFPSMHDMHINVGYTPCNTEHNNALNLPLALAKQLFVPATTLLLDWRMTKKQKQKLFAIHKETKQALV